MAAPLLPLPFCSWPPAGASGSTPWFVAAVLLVILLLSRMLSAPVILQLAVSPITCLKIEYPWLNSIGIVKVECTAAAAIGIYIPGIVILAGTAGCGCAASVCCCKNLVINHFINYRLPGCFIHAGKGLQSVFTGNGLHPVCQYLQVIAQLLNTGGNPGNLQAARLNVLS